MDSSKAVPHFFARWIRNDSLTGPTGIVLIEVGEKWEPKGLI